MKTRLKNERVIKMNNEKNTNEEILVHYYEITAKENVRDIFGLDSDTFMIEKDHTYEIYVFDNDDDIEIELSESKFVCVFAKSDLDLDMFVIESNFTITLEEFNRTRVRS